MERSNRNKDAPEGCRLRNSAIHENGISARLSIEIYLSRCNDKDNREQLRRKLVSLLSSSGFYVKLNAPIQTWTKLEAL